MRFDWTRDELVSAVEAAWHSSYAPRLVELAIALLILLQAWALWPTAQPETLPSRELTSAEPSRPRFSPAALSQLLGAHLFGAASAEVPETAALAPTAFKLVGLYVPDAALLASPGVASPARSASEASAEATGEGGAIAPLAFARTFFGDRTIDSALPGAIAWLSLSGAPGRRVQVGDAIGGATVRDIGPEGVTLELSGRAVRVAFPENPYLAMFRGESNTALLVTDPNAIPAELVGAALRFQPELTGAALTGFRVYPGGDVGTFTRAGLRPGDVVDQIADRDVTLPRDVIPLLLALRDSKSITVRLRRSARPVSLQLFAPAVAAAIASPARTPSAVFAARDPLQPAPGAPAALPRLPSPGAPRHD